MKIKCLLPLVLIILAVSLLCSCASGSNLTGDKYYSGEQVEQMPEEQNDSKLEVGQTDPNRKLIYYVTYEIVTTDFDNSLTVLRDLTNNLGGYTETAEINSRETASGYSKERIAKYVIRIPSDKLNEFFDAIGQAGRVLKEKLEMEDVTLEYVDIQARINSLKLQEERILSILEKADDLVSILDIEKRLADVRYEIESQISTQNRMESLISYSKITLTLTETFSESQIKEPPVSFSEKLTDEFNTSVNRIWNGVQSFAIWFFGNIVEIVFYLAIFTGIVVLIVFLVKRPSKPNKNSNKPNSQPPKPPNAQ